MSNETPIPTRPEDVNSLGIRLQNGLKKGLMWGGIAAAAVVGIGMFSIVPALITGATSGGWVAALLKGAGITVGASTGAFTGILGAAKVAAFGVPALAGGLGLLLGVMDDKPVREAEADAERDFRRAQMRQMEDQRMKVMARRQEIENQRQMDSMGLSRPITPSASQLGGESPGSGMGF